MSDATMMMELGCRCLAYDSGMSPQAPTGMPSMMMVPRCTIRMEKCPRRNELACTSDDELASAAMQNLCRCWPAECGVRCRTWNGTTMRQCNLCSANCQCEMTKDGCCITCTSGDKKCCEMSASLCDRLSACMEAGCCCYVCFGNTPVCCGCCE